MFRYIYAKIVPDFRAFEVNPMQVQEAMELYISADKYCLTGLRDCAKLCLLKGWETLLPPKIEEDVIWLMVHYGFGARTTDVFDDENKSIICQYVHHFMAYQDWFKAVAEELATQYPELRDCSFSLGRRC